MDKGFVTRQDALCRLVGRGNGLGRLCRRLRNWRGHGPLNVLIECVDTGEKIVVPHRRLRKLDKQVKIK